MESVPQLGAIQPPLEWPVWTPLNSPRMTENSTRMDWR